MNAFTEPLETMTEYQEIRSWLHEKAGAGVVEITGCIDSQKLHLLHCLGNKEDSLGAVQNWTGICLILRNIR